MKSRNLENMKTWKVENMKTWKHEKLKTWKHEILKTWKHENVKSEKHKTWKVEKEKTGNQEIQKPRKVKKERSRSKTWNRVKIIKIRKNTLFDTFWDTFWTLFGQVLDRFWVSFWPVLWIKPTEGSQGSGSDLGSFGGQFWVEKWSKVVKIVKIQVLGCQKRNRNSWKCQISYLHFHTSENLRIWGDPGVGRGSRVKNSWFGTFKRLGWERGFLVRRSKRGQKQVKKGSKTGHFRVSGGVWLSGFGHFWPLFDDFGGPGHFLGSKTWNSGQNHEIGGLEVQKRGLALKREILYEVNNSYNLVGPLGYILPTFRII
jgi:hypothetical protein